MPAPEEFSARLRRLAVEDPREARKTFLAAFETNSKDLPGLFAVLRRPSESRLRQVVANAIRTHPEKGKIVHELIRWGETETDEFTRRAIAGALLDVQTTVGQEGKGQQHIAAPSELADVYRYVSGRLRHRLRNTMLSAQAQANRLKSLKVDDLGANVQTTVAKLNDAMISLGRELEATDVDPEHFNQRSIAVGDWLRQLHLRYTTQYSSVNLQLIHADDPEIRIIANDYLLEIIFWNIWLNAHQATGSNCEITITFESTEGALVLLVRDNGDGFSQDLKDVVFQQIYSTKNSGRGRGLLEIQDAVERLGGNIELYEAAVGDYRIRIRLPLEAQ